jgi:hypothetical protein
LFVRDARNVGFSYTLIRCKRTVGHALIFGTGASASIIGRGCCIGRTSSAFGSMIKLENPATNFRPGRSYKEKPPIAGSSPS